MNGWIKLHRSVNDHELLDQDNSCFIVFTKILLRADRKTGTYTTGRFKLAQITNLKPTTAYAALRRLQNDNMVTLASDTKKTVITICNWAKYQDLDDSADDSVMTENRQPNDNKMTQNNTKEVRSKKEKKDTTIVGATYGSPEINQAFQDWQEATGIAITSNLKRNRFAASNLLKKHGAANVGKLLKLVGAAQLDQYAPRIADFCQLQAKVTELLTWAKTKGVTAQKNEMIKV